MEYIIPEVRGHMVLYDLVSPRYKFHHGCKLERYLRYKSPVLFSRGIIEFAICRVLMALHIIIEDQQMFDPENPAVIIADDDMKEALGFRCITSGLLPRKVKDILSYMGRDPFFEETSYIAVYPLNLGKEISTMTLRLHSALPSWSNAEAWALKSGFVQRNILENEACLVEVTADMNEFLLSINHAFEEENLVPYRDLIELVNVYLAGGQGAFTDPDAPGYFFLPDGNLLRKAFGGVKVFNSTQIPSFVRITIIKIKL